MKRTISLLAFSRTRILAALIAMVVSLQVEVGQATAETLVDSKGTSAACVSLILPLGKKCVQLAENAGLISEKNLGYSGITFTRSEEHTSELQSLRNLVCRLLLEKKTLCRSNDVSAEVCPVEVSVRYRSSFVSV